VLGVAAAILAEVQHVFRYHDTAQHAQRTANALEREVNLCVMAAGRYPNRGSEADTLFVERVELIRGIEDREFLATWQNAAEPVADNPKVGETPRPRIEPG